MSAKSLQIRIFIASPDDVHRERDSFLGISNELNRTFDALLGHSVIRLELLRWETNTYPDAGRPQDLITRQIGDYDIFIGILSTRFGTPTGKAGSGTEEEFLEAFATWEKTGRPHICFYFNKAAISSPRTTADAKQLLKVTKFRKKWSSKIFVSEYDGSAFFTDTVRPHLVQLVGDIYNGKSGSIKSERIFDTDKKVTLMEIGPRDACYGQQDKYVGHPGHIIEASKQDGWFRGTFRFIEPLFPGDNRLYSFLQFKIGDAPN